MCHACHSIFDREPWDPVLGPSGTGAHHHTQSELEDAAAVGCGICIRLHAVLPPLDVFGDFKIIYEFDQYRNESLERADAPILRFRRAGRLHEFALVATDGLHESDDSADAPLPTHFANDTLLTTADNWLKTCIREHGICHRKSYDIARLGGNLPKTPYRRVDSGFQPDGTTVPIWSPKRVVEIIDGNHVRLVTTSEKPLSGPYATLSHCWGRQLTFNTLTADNLSTWTRRIPREELAPTFLHAIQVTARLGIRYLWIDSLCILQKGEGSAEDWREHTVTMLRIYACGILNISADRATCGEEGFLGARNNDYVKPALTHGSRSRGNLYQIVDLSFARQSLAESPIAKRGWVLQERLLSPRIIHFGLHQLLWECEELSFACETFPHGMPHTAPQDSLSVASPSTMDHLSGDRRRDWWSLLEDYTYRQLSYPAKDKFIALSGIIERVQMNMAESYHVGFFRQDIPLALLWNVKHSAIDRDQPAVVDGTYRAPSWSWASLDDAIAFKIPAIHEEYSDAMGRCTFAEVLEVSSTPADPAISTGRVTDARIVLRNFAAHVHWSMNSKYHSDTEGVPLNITYPDGTAIPEDFDTVGIIDRPVVHAIAPADAVALLVLSTAKSFGFRDAGLLLAPHQLNGERVYKRIGMWINEREDDGSAAEWMEADEPITLTVV